MNHIISTWLPIVLSVLLTFLGGLAGWHLQRRKYRRHAAKVSKYKISRLTSMRLQLDNADTRNRKLHKELVAIKEAFSDLETKYQEVVIENEILNIKYQKAVMAFDPETKTGLVAN